MSRVIFAILFFILSTINANPMRSEDENDDNDDDDDIDADEKKYLIGYGYLKEENPLDFQKTETQFTDTKKRRREEVRDALKALQTFAHITVTGNNDEETQSTMKKPRCGDKDIKNEVKKQDVLNNNVQGYQNSGQSWNKDTLTWTFEHYNGNDDGITDYEMRDVLTKAFHKWSCVVPLNFQEVCPSQKADVRIKFGTNSHGDTFPFDGKGGQIAHAFLPGTALKGLEGDVHFDDDETFIHHSSEESRDYLRLQEVALHEIGHSLGLDHTTKNGAIMYPFYQHLDDAQLHADDIEGIREIYGKREQCTSLPKTRDYCSSDPTLPEPTAKPPIEVTEKTTDKPTEKTTEKTTEEPTKEPTDKPTEKPTEEPTEEATEATTTTKKTPKPWKPKWRRRRKNKKKKKEKEKEKEKEEGGRWGCFPGDALVRTQDGHKVFVKDLQVGQKVLTLQENQQAPVYSEITMLMHRDSQTKIDDYVKISTAAGKAITLSTHHLIPVQNTNGTGPNFIFGKDVKPDEDFLLIYNENSGNVESALVTGKTFETRIGAYAPLTMEGTIIVDDVYASCYAIFPSHYLPHYAFSIWRVIYDRFSRIFDLNLIGEGIHWYPNMLHTVVNMVPVLSQMM